MIRKYSNWAPLILRAIIGFGFAAHGWAKISRGPEGFEKLLVQIGMPFPHLAATAVPYIELIGGLLIILGAFVTIVAVPLICTMLAALIFIHAKYGFSSVRTIGLSSEGPVFGPPGQEINLLYIAGLVSLMLTGAGMLSIDSMIRRRKGGS